MQSQLKIHVREYNPGAIVGQWWPGKGTCLDVERLPELIAALQKAQAEARERGLLSEGRAA